MPKAEESCQLLHYRTKVPGWPGRLLVSWTRDSTQLQGQVTRTLCLEKTDFLHSFSPYLYIYPYTHNFERASRENFERETLEKTRLTHPQAKREFKKKEGKESQSTQGVTCFECTGHGHFKKECSNYLKSKGKVYATTLSDSNSSNSDSDKSCDGEGNYSAFMTIAHVESSEDLNLLV